MSKTNTNRYALAARCTYTTKNIDKYQNITTLHWCTISHSMFWVGDNRFYQFAPPLFRDIMLKNATTSVCVSRDKYYPEHLYIHWMKIIWRRGICILRNSVFINHLHSKDSSKDVSMVYFCINFQMELHLWIRIMVVFFIVWFVLTLFFFSWSSSFPS